MSHIGELTEIDCPVSSETLARLYRAEPAEIAAVVGAMSPVDAARLALFCYGRAHLRDVGLRIAAGCDPRALIQIAGVMGSVLAEQSRDRRSDFGREGRSRGQARVTLARAAA